jgi:hypothetical protein
MAPFLRSGRTLPNLGLGRVWPKAGPGYSGIGSREGGVYPPSPPGASTSHPPVSGGLGEVGKVGQTRGGLGGSGRALLDVFFGRPKVPFPDPPYPPVCPFSDFWGKGGKSQSRSGPQLNSHRTREFAHFPGYPREIDFSPLFPLLPPLARGGKSSPKTSPKLWSKTDHGNRAVSELFPDTSKSTPKSHPPDPPVWGVLPPGLGGTPQTGG